MDRLIKRFDFVKDSDLVVIDHGVAYQRDMSVIKYTDDYFKNFKAYDDDIARRVNDARRYFVNKHWPKRVIDVGAGDCRFVKARQSTYGFDINPKAKKLLKQIGLYNSMLNRFKAMTMWDVIEHCPNPETYLKRVPKQGYFFASLPIFQDLSKIRESKHYRPNEHLYYFTDEGFVWYMGLYGFRLLERSDHEVKCGRESIGAYAFKKDLPDYHDHVMLYRKMHESQHYGASASLYVEYLLPYIKDALSVLDYGCGRSDLVAYFWKNGGRDLARYDPAVNEYKAMPEDAFDVVLCCDVMEHIPMQDVDRVLVDIRQKASKRVLFVISTKLARATLPDGRNAHVTVLNKREWTRWLCDYFPRMEEIPTPWDHVLALSASK